MSKKKRKSLTKEQKKDIVKLCVTLLLVAAAVAAVVFVLKFYFDTNKDPERPGVIKQEVTSLRDITLSSKLVSVPYVETEIENIVYTANSSGTILFYEYNGSSYSQLVESGSIDVVIPLSGQQIPVKIHYIERNGSFTGYGVYTPEENDSIYIYDYMLCKITKLPKGYAEDGKCLLLANTDIQAVYSNEPVWEEAFVLDRSTGRLTRFLSDGNRMLDSKGALRPDFAMLTNKEIKSTTGVIPFFTGRAYEQTSELKTDLYLKTTSGESLAVSDILDKYTKVTEDGGIVYLKEITGGFASFKYLDGKSTVINEFYSVYGEQYVRSGDWILSREDGRLYCTYSEKVVELEDFVLNPSSFAVSKNGRYVILIGMAANAADYQIWIYDTETGEHKNFSDEDYSQHYNLFFINDTAACFHTSTAEGYSEKIIDASKAF